MRIAILIGALSVLTAAPAAHAVTSAELYSADSYRYGRYEARVQFPPADGVVGSFFLWKNGSETAGAYWNELDFEKLRGDCALQANSIYGRPQSGHETAIAGLTGLCTGYHSYVFEWTPDHIAWLVDGVEVRRDTGAAAQAYAANAMEGMQLRLNIWPGTPAFGGTFSQASLPQHQFVSWVAYSRYVSDAGGDSFALSWRESFEAGRPFGWATGTWASPLQQSTHALANVTIVDGVAVLSLTADDATGFTGTPPQDPGEQPTEHVPSGGAGSGGSSTGSGGSGGTSGEMLPNSSPGCPACSVHTAPDSALGAFGVFALLAGLLALLRHRS